MRKSSYLHAYDAQSTDAMLAVNAQAEADLNDMLDMLIARRDAALVVTTAELPLLNERGVAVVHGARCRGIKLVDVYQDMINALMRIADEYEPSFSRPRSAW